MWRPEILGDVIAERELVFRVGTDEKLVRLRIGRPVHDQIFEKGEPWWCPIKIEGLGPEKVEAIGGEDSLQALILALGFTYKVLPSYAKKESGSIYWLSDGEDFLFSHNKLMEVLSTSIENLLNGLREAEAFISTARVGNEQLADKEIISVRIRQLIESSGFKGE